MGKSNELVFPWYIKNLPENAKRVAILGSTSDSFVHQKYPNAEIKLYDIQLGNWDINSDVWNIEECSYDLVVITRCAYFSKDPRSLIDRCMKLLCTDGHLFIDWGLGDHWRFPKFRVGWKDDDEHEYAVYADQKNFLYSCMWNDKWSDDPTVREFIELINNHGYKGSSLTDIIHCEVPSLIEDHPMLKSVKFLTSWPDAPQLYILTTFVKT